MSIDCQKSFANEVYGKYLDGEALHLYPQTPFPSRFFFQ
jgi:hypothetical protein